MVPAINFNPVQDAHDLRKAMKGFGCDDSILINIITKRSNQQRQLIEKEYKTHFGRDLISDLKSETSGNFENLLIALMTPSMEFYIKQIFSAIDGLGTDEDVLIEFLCGLSNAEMHTICHAYRQKYRKEMESDIVGDTSGHFKRLLVALSTGGRDENKPVDVELVRRDASDLLRAGELKIGTDESAFNLVFCRRSYAHIKAVNEEYKTLTGHYLDKAIESEFSGSIRDGLLAVLGHSVNKYEYYASLLHKSMVGLGTNDNQLIRTIVNRSEIDLLNVKEAFEQKYGKSLKSWIKGDTSGSYKKCLYSLIHEQ